MNFLKKWRFLVLKFVGKFLIRHRFIDDYWVRVADGSHLANHFFNEEL